MSRAIVLRCVLGFLLVTALFTVPSSAQQTLALPADSPRWDLQQGAQIAGYRGRKCLLLNGGASVIKHFEMRDAVIDVESASQSRRANQSFGHGQSCREDGRIQHFRDSETNALSLLLRLKKITNQQCEIIVLRGGPFLDG
jgi:hypothetical protein